jgi:hypothetical protein
MDDILKYFNWHKFAISMVGFVLVILSLFENRWLHFIIYNLVGWFLISYAVALRKDSQDIYDINDLRLVRIGFSYLLMIIGSTLMRYYTIHRPYKPSKTTPNLDDNFYILLVGVFIFALSKAILIIVELNLTGFSQYMTLFSFGTLIMAKILNTISNTPMQFFFSLLCYHIGIAVSIFNISYNPPGKLTKVEAHPSSPPI